MCAALQRLFAPKVPSAESERCALLMRDMTDAAREMAALGDEDDIELDTSSDGDSDSNSDIDYGSDDSDYDSDDDQDWIVWCEAWKRSWRFSTTRRQWSQKRMVSLHEGFSILCTQ